MAPENKSFYKVISLFIKSAILFFSFYYIWDILNDAPQLFQLGVLFSSKNLIATLFVLFLMFVNWSLEAYKWKLLVEPGQLVEIDQPLLIVEAMKMEFSVYADRAAKIGSVHCKPGKQVNAGDLLLVLEED